MVIEEGTENTVAFM